MEGFEPSPFIPKTNILPLNYIYKFKKKKIHTTAKIKIKL